MYVPVNFHRGNAWLCFVAGYLFNGALLWLVTKRTEKEMLNFSPILALHTVINLIYLAVIAVVVPIMPADRGCHALVSLGPLGWLPQPYNFALVFSWDIFLVISLISQPVPFVYRYALLCLRKTHYGMKHYLRMLAIPIVIAMIHIANCYAGGYVPTVPTRQQRQELEEFFSNETLSRIVVPYYANQHTINRIAAFLAPLMAISYTLVVVFSWRIYRHLRRETTANNLSELRVREINQQVSRTLIILAAVPLLAETIPSIWLGSLVFLDISSGDYTTYNTAFFAWAPVINPLVTAWVVHAYRREVTKWVRLVFCMRKPHSTTSVVVLNQAGAAGLSKTKQAGATAVGGATQPHSNVR